MYMWEMSGCEKVCQLCHCIGQQVYDQLKLLAKVVPNVKFSIYTLLMLVGCCRQEDCLRCRPGMSRG